MKILKVLILTVVILLGNIPIMSKELSEPVILTVVYKFQIQWGSRSTTVWSTLVPKSVSIVGGIVIVQNSNGKIGDNTFEFTALESTPTTPKKGRVVFHISGILPKIQFFDIFRVRVGASIKYLDNSVLPIIWYGPSDWILVIDPAKMK